MIESSPELERFLRGEVDNTTFAHREHVRIGFELLRRCDFAETVYRFSTTLRGMAARAGRPEAFHQTITIAFLSLIAERMDCQPYADFESFALCNEDLLDKSALLRLYPSARLSSEAARRTFLLPVPAR